MAGFDQRAPQEMHVAAKRVARLLRFAPDRVLELRAAEDAARFGHQDLEKAHALRRKLHVGAGEADLERARIEREIAGDERLLRDAPAAAVVKRGQPRLELFQRERLYE